MGGGKCLPQNHFEISMNFLILIKIILSILCMFSTNVEATRTNRFNIEDGDETELIIHWKDNASLNSRKEIIYNNGGALSRTYSLINADKAKFNHQGELAELLKRIYASGVVVRVELAGGLQKTSGAGEITSSSELTISSYIREYPYGSWRYKNNISTAQEFSSQKKEVIVALISDGMMLNFPVIDSGIWVNEKERAGIPNFDDDGNGWSDDIYGITSYDYLGKFNWYSIPMAGAILGTGNYWPKGLTNPGGKIKVMPILAYSGERSVKTTTAAILEAFDYASTMGAQIIVIPGYVGSSQLVVEAARNYKGLIITFPDNDNPDEARQCKLLKANLENVVGVGLHEQDGHYRKSYGGPVLLSALGYISTICEWGPCRSSGVEESASKVAGVAAHLMACYPDLEISEVKNLILSSVDQDLWHINQVGTGGILNSAKSVLGRSTGGFMYKADWALLSKDGPPNCSDNYVSAFDESNEILYFMGYGYDDYKFHFYRWSDGKWKREDINPPKETIAEFNEYSILFLNKEDNKLVLFNGYSDFWVLNDKEWERKPYITTSPLTFHTLKEFTYDRSRNLLIGIGFDEETGIISLYEYNWQKWTLVSEKKISAGHYLSHSYNEFNKTLMIPEVSADKKFVKGYWQFDWMRWKRYRTERIPGIGGAYFWDEENKQYLRFGSNHPDTDYSDITLEVGSDLYSLQKRKWTVEGNHLPFFASEHSKKVSTIFRDSKNDVFLALGYSLSPWWTGSKHNVRLWQYSGSIKPTWIDNLPLNQSDYDGDGKADLALWHPATGEFKYENGTATKLGKWGDTPVSGDYDGDGKVEHAVVQRTKGKSKWIFETKTIKFGQFDDIPVPLDYDNDGKTDIAVFRKDTATWYFKGKKPVTFGNPADLPVPADYNGDGRLSWLPTLR
jgi:hypothetical protein